jgi:hypothetical protein
MIRVLAGLLLLSLPQEQGSELTIKGGLQCNGMCLPAPKPEDHQQVLFAVDGSPEITARVKKIMDDFYPENGLDAEAAVKLQDQFVEQLKYFVSPTVRRRSRIRTRRALHYCHASQPSR